MYIVTTFILLLPTIAPSTWSDLHASTIDVAAAAISFGIYQVLFVLLCLSATRAIMTPPGAIPPWLRSDGKSDLHSYSNLLQVCVASCQLALLNPSVPHRVHQAIERKRDGTSRYCRKTCAYKPDRTHYCSEIGQCVLQFQTFSTMMNSAIGFYNYKYYLVRGLSSMAIASQPECLYTIAHLTMVPSFLRRS